MKLLGEFDRRLGGINFKMAFPILAFVAVYGASYAAQTYDFIVIGSGAGGSPVAAKLAQAGKSVLLLEAGPDDSWKGRAAGRTRQTKGPLVDPLLPNNTDLSVAF